MNSIFDLCDALDPELEFQETPGQDPVAKHQFREELKMIFLEIQSFE